MLAELCAADFASRRFAVTGSCSRPGHQIVVPKYRAGVVPSSLRNDAMKALELL